MLVKRKEARDYDRRLGAIAVAFTPQNGLGEFLRRGRRPGAGYRK